LNAARHVAELLFPSHRGWESEMTEVSRLESRYDAFLFASLCEEDELTLRVLSVLARQDVDPWQEADRLAHLSKEHAINSLASRIWKSNGERWSPSEASILVLRLTELLPSYRGSNPKPAVVRRPQQQNDVVAGCGHSAGVNRGIRKQHETIAQEPRQSDPPRWRVRTARTAAAIAPKYPTAAGWQVWIRTNCSPNE
jgi:hypothetical protein